MIIALVSIGIIIAIFFYVFQEASFAFKSPEMKKTAGTLESNQQNRSNKQQEEYVQETYNPNSTSSNEAELIQETYSANANIPELKTKNDNSSAGKADIKSESIAGAQMQPKSVDVAENEKQIAVGSLVMPNDVIDGKPEYIWQPISNVPKYSFIPLIIGSIKVTAIGILVAAPISILAAIFTIAFAPRWMREIIKPAIEILAGFPSVVIGFFCLITLATFIQDVFHTTYRLNSFIGGLGMALAVIPIIYTVTEDALSAVPRYMKEASLAIGASRWQTSWRVILPAATPGVFAAIILGFGRAFGETMIALMATGNAALVNINIFESVRTMSATIGAEMAEVEIRSQHYGILFLIGAVLFVVSFSLNAIAEFYVRKRLMKKFQGI
ncbi:MAG: Phosphate transport system permease protein [Bacteroidota bacterium]|nr:Phosphate transport system permease protein [Bacteroidota bacterium]